MGRIEPAIALESWLFGFWPSCLGQAQFTLIELRPGHGSSEGHEMLKRNDKYHSIADDVPIPKM